MSQKIFISYRREDSAVYARLLFEKLEAELGAGSVFMDVDTIRPGADFVDVVERSVGSCAALIALIGHQWLSCTDPSGRRRIHNPDDLVRIEVATALKRGIYVIPVLVNGARPPSRDDLPDDLVPLARRNALWLDHHDHRRWVADLALLISTIQEALVRQPAAPPVEAAPSLQPFNSTASAHGPPDAAPNPFVWRGAIRSPEAFFDRSREQRVLQSYLSGRQNCQVVGPRRIGKSSLLLQIERQVSALDAAMRIAYLDLQDPRCGTRLGWFQQVARRLGWKSVPADLTTFAEVVEDELAGGSRPVLLIDEFEEWSRLREEFSREFLMTLRYCSQRGMSIVTASQKPLSHLTDPDDQTSPFFNTFPILKLGPFSAADVVRYLSLERPGIPPFSEEEQQAVQRVAQGHPFSLQVASFHVVEAKQNGEALELALERAREDVAAHLSTPAPGENVG